MNRLNFIFLSLLLFAGTACVMAAEAEPVLHEYTEAELAQQRARYQDYDKRISHGTNLTPPATPHGRAMEALVEMFIKQHLPQQKKQYDLLARDTGPAIAALAFATDADLATLQNGIVFTTKGYRKLKDNESITFTTDKLFTLCHQSREQPNDPALAPLRLIDTELAFYTSVIKFIQAHFAPEHQHRAKRAFATRILSSCYNDQLDYLTMFPVIMKRLLKNQYLIQSLAKLSIDDILDYDIDFLVKANELGDAQPRTTYLKPESRFNQPSRKSTRRATPLIFPEPFSNDTSLDNPANITLLQIIRSAQYQIIEEYYNTNAVDYALLGPVSLMLKTDCEAELIEGQALEYRMAKELFEYQLTIPADKPDKDIRSKAHAMVNFVSGEVEKHFLPTHHTNVKRIVGAQLCLWLGRDCPTFYDFLGNRRLSNIAHQSSMQTHVNPSDYHLLLEQNWNFGLHRPTRSSNRGAPYLCTNLAGEKDAAPNLDITNTSVSIPPSIASTPARLSNGKSPNPSPASTPARPAKAPVTAQPTPVKKQEPAVADPHTPPPPSNPAKEQPTTQKATVASATISGSELPVVPAPAAAIPVAQVVSPEAAGINTDKIPVAPPVAITENPKPPVVGTATNRLGGIIGVSNALASGGQTYQHIAHAQQLKNANANTLASTPFVAGAETTAKIAHACINAYTPAVIAAYLLAHKNAHTKPALWLALATILSTIAKYVYGVSTNTWFHPTKEQAQALAHGAQQSDLEGFAKTQIGLAAFSGACGIGSGTLEAIAWSKGQKELTDSGNGSSMFTAICLTRLVKNLIDMFGIRLPQTRKRKALMARGQNFQDTIAILEGPQES